MNWWDDLIIGFCALVVICVAVFVVYIGFDVIGWIK